MRKIYSLIFASILLNIGIVKSQYNVLLNFNGANGGDPLGSLIVSGNTLFGMTEFGGTSTNGNIFSIKTNGSGYKNLFSFNGASNGYAPWSNLLISGGKLYGMTSGGGANNKGCVFSIDTNGTNYKILYDFTSTGGNDPEGSLVISGNVLYGMTNSGGPTDDGTIFSIHTDGTGFKNLLDFNGTNGSRPGGSLILSGNILYGMTSKGGTDDYGVVFSIQTDGLGYKDLFDFDGTNGAYPYGSLILSGNVLFGMTSGDLFNLGYGNIFSIHTNGTSYADLYDFSSVDGQTPMGDLIFINTKLYGMTMGGGSNGNGVIFSIDTDGTGFLNIHTYTTATGTQPNGSLTYAAGKLYGMTYQGGAQSVGVIFSLAGVTAVNELSILSDVGINVFPNPANSMIQYVVSGSNNINGQMRVYDMLGRTFVDKPVQITKGTSVYQDISELESGTYFLQISAFDGSSVQRKFIVDKIH
jgi:uncharacterized repeat protein (TIGR03803 family)